LAHFASWKRSVCEPDPEAVFLEAVLIRLPYYQCREMTNLGGVRLTEREPVNMDIHMKIIVAIADNLLLRAEREAEAFQTTLRRLIQEGLREVLSRKASSKQKPIKPVTFRERGLQPEFRGKSWDAIRDAIYGTAES